MEQQKYFHSLARFFDSQRRRKEFINVRFVSADRQTSYAHKVILSHLLPFWRVLFQCKQHSEDSDETVVILPDYTKDAIDGWLEKVYDFQATKKVKMSKQKITRSMQKKKDTSDSKNDNYPDTEAADGLDFKQVVDYTLTDGEQNLQQTCDVCLRIFNNAKTYAGHLLTHFPKKWNFKCDILGCSKPFRSSRHLQLHQFKEHQKGLTCPTCQKMYSSDSNLKDHIKNVHQNSKLFSCEIQNCRKTFSSKTYLKNHHKTHLDSTQQFRTCPICQKECKGRYYYQHIKSHDSTSYICSDCGDKFLSKQKLVEHQSLVHTGEAHFPCSLCDQSFLTTARRALHKKMQHQLITGV